MLEQSGRPVLLDFGLAVDAEGGAPLLTRSGDLCGTPAYVPPERLAGTGRTADPRWDLWAVGVFLYEALTLPRPFGAPTLEGLYRAIMAGDLPSARSQVRELPRDLEVVLAVCLETSPERRYQTAADLARDLRAVRLVWGAVPDRNGQSDYVVGYADGGQSWGANWLDLIAASQNGFRTSLADRFPLEHTLPMRPVLGRTITFTENNLPNTSPIGAVRISSRTYPNAITIDGMPGCQLWVPDDFSLPFVAHAGSSFVPLPLPAEPRYSGAWLYTQSVLLAPGANAVGVLLSNRLDLRVGVF